ncbi:MAG: cbb3-type cytochrome oxidase assembly protein CcoS [Bacteroidetes bacterium]|nr:cbb3-type cytochrome oxidase assembly protein CcoS [Bacteroidota bacterium]
MGVIFILISASLLIAVGFLIAFIWSVKNNQYEDDYTPSVRILFDNETKQQSTVCHAEERSISTNTDSSLSLRMTENNLKSQNLNS